MWRRYPHPLQHQHVSKSGDCGVYLGFSMWLLCHFCFYIYAAKRSLLLKGVTTILKIILSSFLIEVLFRWAKRQCQTSRFAADFEVLAIIALWEIVTRFVVASLRWTLYKLYVVKWPNIIGSSLSRTSNISSEKKNDKFLQSNILKKMSLVSNLLQ